MEQKGIRVNKYLSEAGYCSRRGADKLIEQGIVPSETLFRSVAAISVGMVDGQPLLDLDYEEDSRAEVDLNVVMSGDGRFVEESTGGTKAKNT